MRNMRIAWQIVELLMALAMDPRYKEAVDKMLDPLEEVFAENKKVIRICTKIREALNVPDDDEEEEGDAPPLEHR